jgi:hypothetical protein
VRDPQQPSIAVIRRPARPHAGQAVRLHPASVDRSPARRPRPGSAARQARCLHLDKLLDVGLLSPERALTITADVLESCGDDLNSPALSSPGSAMSAGSRSASVFAALTTTALLQVSSADVVRHPSVPLELCGCGRADLRPQVRCELRRGDLFGLILRIRRSWFICGVEQCCIGSRSAWTARSGPAALLSSAWSKMEPWQGKRARSF